MHNKDIYYVKICLQETKKQCTSYVNGPSIVSKSCVPIATNVLRLNGEQLKSKKTKV